MQRSLPFRLKLTLAGSHGWGTGVHKTSAQRLVNGSATMELPSSLGPAGAGALTRMVAG